MNFFCVKSIIYEHNLTFMGIVNRGIPQRHLLKFESYWAKQIFKYYDILHGLIRYTLGKFSMKYNIVFNNKFKEGLSPNAVRRNGDYVNYKNSVSLMIHMYTDQEKLIHAYKKESNTKSNTYPTDNSMLNNISKTLGTTSDNFSLCNIFQGKFKKILSSIIKVC